MKPKYHRLSALVASAALAAASGVALLGVPAAYAGTNGGAATITKQDAFTPLGSGGSGTLWSIVLPPQAHCSGDSASHGFHVFSYIVPSTTDPSTLSFTSSGPSAGNPLYDQGGSPYIAANTAPTSGQVIQIPNDFNWALFSPDGSAGISNPNGAYNVGIACATGTGVEDIFWNVVVTFTASSSDPNGQVWTAANPTPNVPEVPWNTALPISAVVILGAGALFFWRRSRKEQAVA